MVWSLDLGHSVLAWIFQAPLMVSFSQLLWRLSKVKTSGPRLLGMSVNLLFCYTCFGDEHMGSSAKKKKTTTLVGEMLFRMFVGCFYLFIYALFCEGE